MGSICTSRATSRCRSWKGQVKFLQARLKFRIACILSTQLVPELEELGSIFIMDYQSELMEHGIHDQAKRVELPAIFSIS